MTSSFRIALAEATDCNMKAILRLIRQASGWLADMGTDQWQEAWPDVEGRDARVWRGLEVGATWIVWAGERAAATVTVAQNPNMEVWQNASCTWDEPAVYAHRLIIDRQFAGFGLGAQLIDWAGLYGQDNWEAEWIRIDVWSTNEGLHEYYMNTGFEPCGTAPDPDYPSGMLFQKSVRKISKPVSPLFTEGKASSDPFGADAPNLAQLDLDHLYRPLDGRDGSLVSCSIPDVIGQLVLSGAGGPVDPVRV
jgi:GNAT superfamily N-acetyltransferase